MIVINLIDKDRVRGEDGFGDSRAVWRARLFLFIGFALMAGGLAGSVVRPAIYVLVSCPYISSLHRPTTSVNDRNIFVPVVC